MFLKIADGILLYYNSFTERKSGFTAFYLKYESRWAEEYMCGRYYVDDGVLGDIKELVEDRQHSADTPAARDIHPGELAPVLREGDAGLLLENMRWGFPQYREKGLLINARSETVLNKKTFRESVLYRRCVIPARHFYEWDAEKNKASFQRGNGGLLYMAGFYHMVQNEARFVILTTQANSSVSPVHERMPLILEKEEVKNWICDAAMVRLFLNKLPLPLKRVQKYEQQSLFSIWK